MSAFIAGGTSGLGRAIARRLARHNPLLFLGYHSNDAAAEDARRELSATCDVHLIKADLADRKDLVAAFRKVRGVTSKLDTVVHSAATVSHCESFMELDPVQFDRAIAVSGSSLLHLVQASYELLHPGSSVIFLSGRAVDDVLKGHSDGSAAGKALGECLVRYLAIELSAKHIRVNTIRSGPVDTPMLRRMMGKQPDEEFIAPTTPAGVSVDPEDIAEAAAFLASPSARMITGQILTVDGGRSIAV